jgi:hypothetical protein
MKSIFDTELMAERLESLKAGIIGGSCLGLTFTISTLVNSFLLGKYFKALYNLNHLGFNTEFLLSGGIAVFSGLLFGVTYRYIIRSDKNSQLKAGGVMAFGLVRGLTQVDTGFNSTGAIVPFLVLSFESILSFAVAGFVVDTAIQLNWVKPFKSE